jgi:hypothetical protein
MESDHHSIKASELRKHLADIPDDSEIGFIAETTVLHLTEIKPDRRPGHEGEFRMAFKACNNPIGG